MAAHAITGLHSDPLGVPNGLYVEIASTIGSPGGLTAEAGYVKHHRGGSSASQTFETAAPPVRKFQRNYAGSSWSAWVEEWHTGNLTRAVNYGAISEDTDGTQVPDLASVRWLNSAFSTAAGTGDWDANVLPGVASRLMGAGDANGPGFGGYAYCRTTSYSSVTGSNSLLQEAIGYGSGNTRYARRHRQGATTWYPWVEEWNSANLTPTELAPPGMVAAFARNSAPAGWLKANGAAISRTTYAALFSAIGTTFGVGDGTTTFNLPDGRGEFIRGWDDARGVDSGRAFGSWQADDNKSHTHSASTGSDGHTHTWSGTTSSDGAHTHSETMYNTGSLTGASSTPASGIVSGTAYTMTTTSEGAHTHTVSGTTSSDSHTHTVSVVAAGGSEARPRNLALLTCIKY